MKLWDYLLPNGWEPKTAAARTWYLERRINYGNFRGLNPRTVHQYLPKLRIDPGKREMLERYFRTYGAQ